jgi:transcriptional regulator with XRE-family HTH domain
MDQQGEFAQRLDEERAAADVSSAELARRVGVSRGTVSRWLSGERVPDASKIFLIADALRCSPAPLLRAADRHADAERWEAKQGIKPEPDPLGPVRHALGAVPIRPPARAALLTLVKELARDESAEIRQRAEEAWEYAHQPIGAFRGEMSREQYERQAFERFMRKMYGIEVYRDGPRP